MSKLIVVGCGGTGSNLLPNLSQYMISSNKIREVILIDKDVIETKNFKNQKFTSKDVGKYKSQVLARRFSSLGINISYINKYITKEEDLIDIINKDNEPTILVGCVDNNKARIIMDKTFYSDQVKSLAYIDSGNGTVERRGQVVLGVKAKGKVIAPPVSEYFDLKVDEDEGPKKVSYQCSNIKEHPQNFATNVLAATTVFMLIVNLVEGIKIGNKVIGFNVDKLFIDKYNPLRN